MKKKIIFLLLLAGVLVLSGCRKNDLFEEEKMNHLDGLFLKTATSDEKLIVQRFLENGQEKIISVPNNILFLVKEEKAVALKRLIEVVDYSILSEKEAVFRIADYNAVPIYLGELASKPAHAPHTENAYAVKLPFSVGDYSLQDNTRIGGLLKANDYILSVKDDRVLIYDQENERLMKASNLENGASYLSFMVQGELWLLTLLSTSTTGNIFSLQIKDNIIPCMSLDW